MVIGTTNPYYDSTTSLQKWKKGPLGPYLDGFSWQLYRYGYCSDTGQEYIRSIGYFSQWLEQQKIKANQISKKVIQDYSEYLKYHKDIVVGSAPQLLFLTYLYEIEVINRPSPKSNKQIDIVQEYLKYLRKEKGLAESTLPHRRLFANRFLEERYKKKPIVLSQLTINDFIDYINRHASEFSSAYCRCMVLVLRDFCKFLYVQNHIKENIAIHIPRVPHWKANRLPASIAKDDINHVLSKCERNTPQGMRDYAILLLLIRLGLRAGEIRNLTLDDIDWENGEIMICGKGCKRNRLPLPQEVGNALVQYLKHGRPPCSSRSFFIRMRAPYTKILCSTPITKIVKKAFRQAGLPSDHISSHALRHTFATNLLKHGAELTEISRLLGHENLQSTQVYAQVDKKSLHNIAQPWPGGEL